MTFAQDKLWGRIDLTRWKETSYISGRLATEKDVKDGIAVFYIAGDGITPLKIKLPACAVHHDVETKIATPVILVQAEETPKAKTIGFRFITGGNGICTLAELEILQGPDERFK